MKSFSLMGIVIATLLSPGAQAQDPGNIESNLVVLNLETGREAVIMKEQRHFEAPNWSRDGQYLVINAAGKLEKISLDGRKLGTIPTGSAQQLNNDHGFSFDGQWLIISNNDPDDGTGGSSRIYRLPAEGGTPQLLTPNKPSYWHGISPDGKHVVYCANRNNAWDVYKIPVDGGPEVQLTNSAGLDDGPEYSYDGKWIYFNSNRSGRMHIYRMAPDGTVQEQLTRDGYDNWFAHPSPDNRSIVYLAYLEDQKGQHPFGRDVKLRIMDLETKTSRDLTPVFFGGQGTINVPSWSPDGKQIAFVRYRKIS